jgi:hypothetical protein
LTNYANSVQQVSITIASGSTTGTATIDAAVGTHWMECQGQRTSATSQNNRAFARVSISGTTVTATRNTGTSSTVVVNAFIVDADANLVDSVQYGTITGETTATISSVTTTDSAISILGWLQSVGTFNYDVNSMAVDLTNATTVTSNSINTLSGTVVTGFVVIEFNNAALAQNTQEFATTWVANATSTTQTITSVNVNNTKLFFAGGGSPDGNTNAREQPRIALTNATTVTITIDEDTTNDQQCNFSVVAFASGVLSQNAQRGTIAIAAGTSTNTATPTSADTDLSACNFLGWTTTETATTSHATIRPSITQTNATTITANTNTNVAAGDSVTVSWELLTFTNDAGGAAVGTIFRTPIYGGMHP